MKLLKLSNDFTPRQQGLFFGIETEGEEPTNVVVEVVDAELGQVVATQLLREIISAKINIAPYVASEVEYAPTKTSPTTFREAPSARYCVRVGEVESDAIRVSINRRLAESPSLVTTMPNCRHIDYGEADELLVMASPEDEITAEIMADSGESISLKTSSESGALILHISTEDFGKDIRKMDVELLCNGEPFARLCYVVFSRHRGSVRLAWVSEEGSIEQYTFPRVVRREVEAIRECVTTQQGKMVVGVKSESQLSLMSRYEPRHTIKALADIISSPKVWMVREGGCEMVEVASSHIESNLFGEPDFIALSIVEWSREVSL